MCQQRTKVQDIIVRSVTIFWTSWRIFTAIPPPPYLFAGTRACTPLIVVPRRRTSRTLSSASPPPPKLSGTLAHPSSSEKIVQAWTPAPPDLMVLSITETFFPPTAYIAPPMTLAPLNCIFTPDMTASEDCILIDIAAPPIALIPPEKDPPVTVRTPPKSSKVSSNAK